MIGFKVLAREMPELVLRMRNICTMAAVLPLLAGCGPAPPAPAAAVLMIACLPPRAHVPELVIKPTSQDYA